MTPNLSLKPTRARHIYAVVIHGQSGTDHIFLDRSCTWRKPRLFAALSEDRTQAAWDRPANVDIDQDSWTRQFPMAFVAALKDSGAP